ncbi:MAG: glycosyltransferase family 2 protein [Pseudomonadota bacterium]
MSSPSKPTLSVIVPVFNEHEFVEKSLRRLISTRLEHAPTREIIVVDDGSTDGSRELLRRLQTDLGFRLVEFPRNRGKGAAIRKGIEEAAGEFIGFHDADLEYDPADLDKMLLPLKQGKADAVYGSRFAGGEERRLLFYWHQLGNRIITWLTNMVTNVNFSDIESCYKMFRASDLKKIPLRSDRFSIEPEITIKAAKQGLRFYEVSVSYNGRTYAQGKKINWSDGLSAVYHIFRFAFFK